MSDVVTSIQPNERATPSNGARARYTARDVGSLLIVLIGLAVLFSAVPLNPWFGRLIWSEHAIDKLDVLTRYAWTSVVLGSVIVFLGMRVGRLTDGGADGSSLLGLLICLLLVFDRLLLVHFGLPLWIHDPVLHYRHRPNAVRTLARAGRPQDTVRINRYGHHDTEFPRQKPSGELRGLMVGDSVTMGDQLVYEQTFSAQLEKRLREGAGAFTSYEMINTGVHGYATYQEVEVLRESMAFDPDFIVVGFCLNDLTDPSVAARGFEGRSDDYHHVAASANPIQGYFLNETGLGRLVQEVRGRGKTRSREVRAELEAVHRISTAKADDPEWAETWRWVHADLDEMARISRELGRPFVLLAFPFTFQRLDPHAREPQAILAAHAQRLGIDFIDFTPIFSALVYQDDEQDDELLRVLRERGISSDRVERIFEPEIRRYFLDNDHLTEAGHAVVAETLEGYLNRRGILRGEQSARGSGL